jgi:hypothetical protein
MARITYQKLFCRVRDYYGGNLMKANLWFRLPNPVLNGMRPKDYKIDGKWDALGRLVDDALKATKKC